MRVAWNKGVVRSPRERFWEKVNKTSTCWEWTGATVFGYGVFTTNTTELKKTYRAHRFAWEDIRGKIPKGMALCHRCDNRKCVRPQHIFVGTAKDNAQDAVKKGRNSFGERNGTAKLTNKQAQEIKILYKTGAYAQRDLARKFQVSQTTIWSIVRGVYWKHICV